MIDLIPDKVVRKARVGWWLTRRRAAAPLVDWRRRLATLLGAVTLALAAILFARVGDASQGLFTLAVRAVWWLPLLLTPAVYVGVVWLTRRYLPDARGSGIPQVIAAARTPIAAVRSPLVSLRTGLGKMGLTLAMLGAGGSVGREGPTVQVSAALMVAVHRRLGVRISSGVLIAGGAAGVAAAFNTPLAGIAFAIEELAVTYEQRMAVIVMGAVMIAGLTSLGVSGDYIYFGRVPDHLTLWQVLTIAPVAGIAGGICGGLFSRLLLSFNSGANRVARLVKSRPLIFAGACGMTVAVIGLACGGVTWGTGYEPTRQLLQGHAVTPWFGPAKLAASIATALSGAPGGIFAPSLAIGAGLGQLLTMVVPHAPIGPVILLGMIAYFVGVVRAPFTAVIIVSEATGNHSAILALFATALIADWVSALVCPTRLYHGLASAFLPDAPASPNAVQGTGEASARSS